MEQDADFVESFPGSLRIQFRPTEQNFQKIFSYKILHNSGVSRTYAFIFSSF